MNRTVLYIDGENFRHFIEQILTEKYTSANILNLDLNKLLQTTIKGVYNLDKVYYSAKLRETKSDLKKARELIHKQRLHKALLENAGVKYVLSGNVRAQKVAIGKKSRTVFREKGVDVKIAVDLTTEVCDKAIKTAILCSSDSDLQPAVTLAKERKVSIIYLGFSRNPNKGLMYTTDQTILISDQQVLDCYVAGHKP